MDAAIEVATMFGLTKWMSGVFCRSSRSGSGLEEGLVLACRKRKDERDMMLVMNSLTSF